MRHVLTLILALCLFAAPVAAQAPAPAPVAPAAVTAPQPSEVLQLRLEIHALHVAVAERDVALAQTQKKLQEVALLQERTDLDASVKRELPGWHMDWEAGRIVSDTEAQVLR